MKQMYRIGIGLGILVVGILGSIPPRSEAVPPAQAACEIIDSPDDLGFPLPTDEFRLMQPFGRPSGRFEGKLHAGEDWVGARGRTYGEPVYAIAPGRVTFSSTTAWGRDKGVVIVQHTFADGSSIYSFYGHLEEVGDITFVAANSCVQKGDVVGAIGDPRPAPHLHFEIRNFSPNAPGPGYWEVDPRLRGWFNPRQFIINWQAWLSESHVWHRPLLDPTGPYFPAVMRNDGVMIFLDDNLVRAYNSEGGRLWEYRLADSISPIGFAAYGENELLIANADGRLQVWNQLGGFLYEWNAGISLAQSPVVWGGKAIFRSPDNQLVIFDEDRNLSRQYADIMEITSFAATAEMAALITATPELILLQADGSILQRYEVRLGSDVVNINGQLFVRDRDILRRIADNGELVTVLEDLSVNRSDRSLLATTDGQLIMWGINGKDRLLAVNPRNGEIIWETDVESSDETNILSAQVIQADACTLVLAERRGRIFTFDLATGEQLDELTLWGSNLNGVWIGAFATDSVLRVHIGDQLAGFDTRILAGRVCEA